MSTVKVVRDPVLVVEEPVIVEKPVVVEKKVIIEKEPDPVVITTTTTES